MCCPLTFEVNGVSDYLNTTCTICGTKYHVCGSCANAKTFKPWRTIACSINCYKIFMALNSYTNGYATKEETRTILEELDLSNLETLEENIKASIQEILREKAELK